jgi:glycosyltransferase involved in cell wall biosynthesis
MANTKGQHRKIKVLRVISRMNIGGPSIHVSLLLKGLDPQQFESKLVTGSLSDSEGDMSYLLDISDRSVIRIPELRREIDPIRDVVSLRKLLKILVKEKPDIVHSHTSKAGLIARLAVKIYNAIYLKKIKIVHTFHGNILHGYFGVAQSYFFMLIERFLAKLSDALIAISESQYRELTQLYRIADPHKVHLIRLGFDLSKFTNSSKLKGEFRKKIGIDEQTLLIGIVGRLVPIKNHRLFLDAAKLFIERNPSTPVRFIIVGDGELKTDLKSYAERIGIAERVIFYGWEKNIESVYADLNILALTSINEGTPVSIIEAMASSTPVISTKVGGVADLFGKEICADGNSKAYIRCERGALFVEEKPISVAKGIEHFIDQSKNYYETSNTAKRYILNTFDKSVLITTIELLYSKTSS